MLLKTASLTPHAAQVICHQATEHPFTGEYNQCNEAGTYLCRQCGLALFRAHAKFPSACGWPSFDEEIPSAVRYTPDADGFRTEITCARCHGHLGHVFKGEGLTAKNTRHCVNSVSLDFIADLTITDTEEVIVAGGCFWGVEHYFNQLPGVLKTEVGYTGGTRANPTYEDVCRGDSGHIEAIRVVYDPQEVTLSTVLKYFLEIHDPTQTDGQGPDLGEQYLSVIFYYNDEQKKVAQPLLTELEKKGYKIATQLLPVAIFWTAEKYHQQYYQKTGKSPYCHRYVKRF